MAGLSFEQENRNKESKTDSSSSWGHQCGHNGSESGTCDLLTQQLARPAAWPTNEPQLAVADTDSATNSGVPIRRPIGHKLAHQRPMADTFYSLHLHDQ